MNSFETSSHFDSGKMLLVNLVRVCVVFGFTTMTSFASEVEVDSGSLSAFRELAQEDLPTFALKRYGTLRLRTGSSFTGQLAVSPSGETIASMMGSDGEYVGVWDIRKGRLHELLSVRGSGGRALAFSYDGTLLACSNGEALTQVWEWKKGREAYSLPITSEPVTYSHDGKWVACLQKNRISLHVAKSAKLNKAISFPKGVEQVDSLRFSRDNSQIVGVVHGCELYTWNVRSGKEVLSEVIGRNLSGFSVFLSSYGTPVAFHQHDRFLLQTAAGNGASVEIAGTSRFSPFALSSSGKIAAVTSGELGERVVRLVSVEMGQNVGKLRGVRDRLACLEFARNDELMVGCSIDCIYVWRIADRKLMQYSVDCEAIRQVALSPDGTLIVAQRAESDDYDQRGFLTCWNTVGTELWRTDECHSLMFESNSRALWTLKGNGHLVRIDAVKGVETARKKLEVWDGKSPRTILTFRGEVPIDRHVESVTMSRDGKSFAYWISDGRIAIWSNATNEYNFVPGEISSGGGEISFLQDQTDLLALRMGILDSKTGKYRQMFVGDILSTLWVAPIGDTAVIAREPWGDSKHNETEIAFIKLQSEKELARFTTDKWRRNSRFVAGNRTDATFSPDGRWFVIGDNGGSIHVFHTRDGTELIRLTGHLGSVTSISFSADGTKLASGSMDSTVVLWDFAEAIRAHEPLD